MEVKRGYKQTEVGVIPEEWDDLELGQTTRDDSPICYGIVQVGPHAANGIRVLAIKNLNSDYTTNIHCASAEIERAYARSRIRPDDVLVSVKGTTGRIGIVPPGFHGNISRDLARIRLREGMVPSFFFQMLQSELAQRRLAVAVVGTTRMELSIAILKKVRIPVPHAKREQEAIAEALSDADALIESLEQLIAKKRLVKQGAMQELLCPKSGWVAAKLGSVGAFLKGSGIRKDECRNGSIPCVRYGELYTNHFDCIRAFYSWIPREVASTARRLKPGDVLFAGSGETKEEIGKCAAFVDEVEAYAGGDIVILRPEGVDSLFLGYYLNTAPVCRQKASRGQGDAVVHISSAALAGIDVMLPPTNEQTAIAAVLSDMDAELAAMESKLAKARQMKQGMMQELLTGRIRLI